MCLAAVSLSAQDIIIFGQVVSAADGEPIQAANVWFKNTQIGTATNNEGYFILRSNESYKTLCVSVVGFRRKEVKLTGGDQVLTIALKEERNVLNELIVLPADNEALPLLRRVRERAAENNPDKIDQIATIEQQNVRLSLTNIRRKTLQRKLLRDLTAGTITADDSTLFMPLYDAVQVDAVTVDSVDGVVRNNLSHDEKTLQVLPPNQVGVFLQNYAPNVNFYRSHVTVLQTNFISPLSAQGTLYYQYFLIDSVLCDSAKAYYVRFRPKNDKELAFKGEMWIDSASLALRRIKASLSPAAAINYLNGLTIEQTFAPTANGKFYYDRRDYAMSFSLNLFDKNAKNGTSVIYAQHIENRQTACGDSQATAMSEISDSVAVFTDSATQERRQFRSAIDSLNQSKLQRIAYGLVDFVLNGYVHAWKFDIGPGINWFRYNKLEGFRPTLALRTGEKLTEYFTVGGYVGYGFGDKQWKYGGELQARWGEAHAHSIGLFYDNDVVRHGYRFAELVGENMYGSPENLLTTCSFVVKHRNLYQIHQAAAQYRYEQSGVRFTLRAQGTEYLSNEAMPFVQNDVSLQQVRAATVSAGLRLSFKENTLDYFFHRYYLRTNYPIVNVVGEYGYYTAGAAQGHFGQVRVALKHDVPLFSGRLKYTLESGYIFGNVPWLLLETPRMQRNFWSQYDFGLLTPMEFMSDAYVTANVRYITSGWIFNYIPYVKKANLREELIFRIAYGGLRSGHDGVLALPESVGSLQKMPYIEAGVGICNILRLLSVQSIWRVTYRDTPDAIKWGIRVRLELGF